MIWPPSFNFNFWYIKKSTCTNLYIYSVCKFKVLHIICVLTEINISTNYNTEYPANQWEQQCKMINMEWCFLLGTFSLHNFGVTQYKIIIYNMKTTQHISWFVKEKKRKRISLQRTHCSCDHTSTYLIL